VSAYVPLRDERMRRIFQHVCGARKTCASDDPVRYGGWCPRCSPDDGTDTFDWPASSGWAPVFGDEGLDGAA
jgi:hypothetical protein